MLTRLRIFQLFLAVVLLSATSSITPAADITTARTAVSAEPIKIGFVSTLTGRLGGTAGREMVNGFRLFLEQNNYEIAGRKVELIIEDDQNSVPIAVSRLRKLVEDDKVHVISGFLRTAHEVADHVDKFGTPVLFPVTASDDITKRKHSTWIVRTGWSASQAGHPFGKWVRDKLKYKKIAVIAADFPTAWEMVGGFQRTFEEAGGQIIQKVSMPMVSTDYSSHIKKLRKDADAVYVCVFADAGVAFAQQLKQLLPTMPIVASGPSYDERVIRKDGKDSLGVISANYYSAALDTPNNKKFITAYHDKYGIEPDVVAEGSYVSGMWIKKAIESLKGDVSNKQKLVQALRKVELSNAPRGPIKLDSYGSPIENIYVRKVEKVNDDYQNVVIHTFPKVSQFWKYDPTEFLSLPPYSKNYPPCKYCETE